LYRTFQKFLFIFSSFFRLLWRSFFVNKWNTWTKLKNFPYLIWSNFSVM
jgi:hypothetical protein